VSSLLHAPARTAAEAAAIVNAHKTRVFIDTSGGDTSQPGRGIEKSLADLMSHSTVTVFARFRG
jgi:hypothetical protein